MADQQSASVSKPAEERVVEKGLLDQIVDEGRMARDPAARERGKNLVKEFVSQVLEGAMTVSRDTEAMINARIAQIDHLLSIQLNEILHHPSFQKLEGTWRGLKYLMDQSETSVMLKIKVLNCSKSELLRDLQRAPEFDQSAAFKKIYEEEFGSLRRRSVRRDGRRLRVRQAPGRHRAAGEDLPGGGRRPCAVPDRGRRGPAEHGQLHQPGSAARPGQDLRHHRVRQVEVLPPERRLALRRAVRAARADAPALWQGHEAGGRLQLRRGRGRNGSLQVPVGQRGLCARGAADATRSRFTAGAPPSAAWKAAAWWRACRRTPSTPTRATWR